MKVASEPEALVAFFASLGFAVKRVGLEAGPLSADGEEPWSTMPESMAWGRLNVVTPFHHLSEDSHINCPLRAGPITASRTVG
jgi:hypothetical protein